MTQNHLTYSKNIDEFKEFGRLFEEIARLHIIECKFREIDRPLDNKLMDLCLFLFKRYKGPEDYYIVKGIIESFIGALVRVNRIERNTEKYHVVIRSTFYSITKRNFSSLKTPLVKLNIDETNYVQRLPLR